VIGEWRRLYSEELHDLYCSKILVIKSTGVRLAGHVARMGERRRVDRVLVGRPEGKGPLGRCRHRWEENIKL
jgi:hypothetical protein